MIAEEQSRSQARIQSHDLSNAISNKIESISTNLDIIVHGHSIVTLDMQHGPSILRAAANSTSDITSGYGWLDKNGKLLWTSSKDKKYVGSDLSFRSFYYIPKETLNPYYSTSFQSLNGAQVLSISYPIITELTDTPPHTFNGVIVAGILVNRLGQFAQQELASNYNSTVGILDKNGIILYSSDSPKLVGKNIFAPEAQSLLPADIKDTFNQFIHRSLNGKSGYGDFVEQGKTSTIAYDPVQIHGNDFAVVYVVTPHNLAASANEFIVLQRTINLIIIFVIGAFASVLSILSISWGKKLEKLVNLRTTQLSISNKQVQEQDERQQEFINIAAHELKTPIQPILTTSEKIEEELRASAKGIFLESEDAKRIVRNSKRLARLANDLLMVSKLEFQTLPLKIETINLKEEINLAIDDLKSFIPKDKDLKIIFNHAIEDKIFVHADRVLILEILSNLIRNAIKFTEKGIITVSLSAKGSDAVVSVHDTGVGISPEILPKLFDKYQSKSGTGLGLFISKKLIELHKGNIWVSSEDGKGSTFSFSLPINKIKLEIIEKDLLFD